MLPRTTIDLRSVKVVVTCLLGRYGFAGAMSECREDGYVCSRKTLIPSPLTARE